MSEGRTRARRSHEFYEIGSWSTISGENPTARELVEDADAVLEGTKSVSECRIRRTLQYIWRRQKHPHGAEWKLAEKRCSAALKEARK